MNYASTCTIKCMTFCFVYFLEFIFPLDNFSLIWRRHHCRWRAANFDLSSALMTIEQWGFFNVPHPLRHGPTVHNRHLRGPVTLCCRAFGSGVVITLNLRLRPLATGVSRSPACEANALPLRHPGGLWFRMKIIWIFLYIIISLCNHWYFHALCGTEKLKKIKFYSNSFFLVSIFENIDLTVYRQIYLPLTNNKVINHKHLIWNSNKQVTNEITSPQTTFIWG